ncbi:MAG: hypothetical protein K9G70_10080, partial [Prolixibacteraceae bacterium]|nr:hypothetical protein [Prolixibacteraceae bacterium]
MTSGKGTKRLGKVAREFNVGISTMVEFLNKKGHQVEPNPNAKIDDEKYALLQKEYSSDIDLKKESEKLNIRTHRHQKNESVTLDDLSEGEKQDDDDDISDEDKDDDNMVIIKDLSAKKSNAAPKEPSSKKVEEIKTETPKQSVKILGKIDIDDKKAPSKKSTDKKEPKNEPKKEAPSPEKNDHKPEKPEVKEEKTTPKAEKP